MGSHADMGGKSIVDEAIAQLGAVSAAAVVLVQAGSMPPVR